MCLKAKPIVNTVAVEMGSIDACSSPSKHPWTDLLALSEATEDNPMLPLVVTSLICDEHED